MMKIFDMKISEDLKWSVATLAVLSLLMLVAAACGPPREVEVVVEKIVEVEKVVEVEVPVEVEKIVQVVVTATPELGPTATPLPAIDVRASKKITADGRNIHSRGMFSGDGFGAFSCVLSEDGEAVCWGGFGRIYNDGSFRLREDEDWPETKAARPPGGRFTAIDAGREHTCALSETGNPVCWGSGSRRTTTPGGRFVAISAGMSGGCGLRESDEMACWGGAVNRLPDSRYKAISVGRSHVCGLSENGDALCSGWADSFYVQDVLGARFVMISAGSKHTCGLRSDGTGACWGTESNSEIVPLDGPFKTLSAGYAHACALYVDGTATCWGDGSYGQSSPPPGRFAEIAAGATHTCGLLENGRVVCWGSNIASESSPPRELRATSTRLDLDALPAIMLARLSTSNAVEGENRAAAASDILTLLKSGRSAYSTEVFDLLNTIAPELSIEARQEAVDELARLSEDDDWGEDETVSAVLQLSAVITGNEVNSGERIDAAHEMVALYESGDLDTDTALALMDTIAPGLSIEERRQAAAALARLSADDDWDDADRMAAASEVFRLVTGVPLAAEARVGATVDLVGLGVKVFGDDQFSDREIDAATTIIKQAIGGSLTSESLAGILGFGN